MDNNKKIYAAVTCDTEFLPPWYEGTWEKPATWTFEPGVDRICEVLNKYGIKGTFFTQGTVATKFPNKVAELHNSGHLIGSHGYNHENYGGKPVNVWTESVPVFLENKEIKHELLLKASDEIEKVVKNKPEVFVSPFDNIDEELLTLLDKTGIKVDCSFHNYTLNLNSFPFYPLKEESIVEIPLTVLPMDPHGNKNVLECFAYDLNAAKDKLEKYIEESEKTKPFTVVLLTCHPYEFTDTKIPHPREVLIVGKEKTQALDNVISTLKGLGAEFVNPLDIADNFKKINGD